MQRAVAARESIALDFTDMSFTGKMPIENVLLRRNARIYDGVPARQTIDRRYITERQGPYVTRLADAGNTWTSGWMDDKSNQAPRGAWLLEADDR